LRGDSIAIAKPRDETLSLYYIELGYYINLISF